eukprot:3938071-Rhodomonas_salina.1
MTLGQLPFLPTHLLGRTRYLQWYRCWVCRTRTAYECTPARMAVLLWDMRNLTPQRIVELLWDACYRYGVFGTDKAYGSTTCGMCGSDRMCVAEDVR